MTEDDAALISDEIRRRVPRTIKVVATREGQVPASVLLGLSAAAEDDLAARPSHHDNLTEHDHDDFETFIVDIPELASATDLASRAKARFAIGTPGWVKADDIVSARPLAGQKNN